MEWIDLVNSVIISVSQITLLRWLTFLLGSLTLILKVLLLWICFFLQTLAFVLQWLSLHWEILIIWLFQFPLTFSQTQNRMSHFIVWIVFVVIWEIFFGRISLIPVLLLLLVNYVSWFRLESMYISLMVNISSSPWFSAACAAGIVHGDHFFLLYLQNKSSESKVTFRQASNHCKKVLKATKRAYANKTKKSIFSQ